MATVRHFDLASILCRALEIALVGSSVFAVCATAIFYVDRVKARESFTTRLYSSDTQFLLAHGVVTVIIDYACCLLPRR